MGKASLSKKLIIVTAGLLAILTTNRNTFVPSRKQEIPKKSVSQTTVPQKTTYQFSESEKSYIELFRTDEEMAFYAMVSENINYLEKIAKRTLKMYEQANPQVQEQVRGDVAKSMSYLIRLCEYTGEPERFCPYNSRAIRLGLRVEEKEEKQE